MRSIVDADRKVCHVCGRTSGLHRHHIFYGPYRKWSEIDGLTCNLCMNCHEGYFGVHGFDGYELNASLKREAERKWLEHYGKTVEEFIQRYGKSWL